jgi:Ca-activated chloride channel family protein
MELDQVMAPAGRHVERHVLVTLRTPPQVPADQTAHTVTGRAPIHFTAVLDVSGSMSGEKLTQAKEAVRQALSRLHDGDVISLITFSAEARCVLEPTVVDDRARQALTNALQRITASGMTALCGGLEMGIATAIAARRDTNLVLVLSDGQANVGETDIEKVGFRGLQARQQGLIVSTLGVGSDYNEALMAEIATQGGGRFYHVQRADQIQAYLTGELGEVAMLAARHTCIVLTIPAGSVVIPLSAAYPTTQDGTQAVIAIGDIPTDTELEAPIRVTLSAQAPGSRLSFEGAVTYRSPAGSALKTALNRVTVRFTEQPTFHQRDGVVAPVVERVLDHMKAASVLGLARTLAQDAPAAARQAEVGVTGLRDYAALLGDERAATEAAEAARSLGAFQAAPAMAKPMVADAFARQRSARKFEEKK